MPKTIIELFEEADRKAVPYAGLMVQNFGYVNEITPLEETDVLADETASSSLDQSLKEELHNELLFREAPSAR